MELPKIKGFTANRADAFWVTCDKCGDNDLFYGSMADVDALTWASEHQKVCWKELAQRG